jgi:hypothetical protein
VAAAATRKRSNPVSPIDLAVPAPGLFMV